MQTLLNLVGSIALLLWGIRMIRTGIMRSFGAELRRIVARAGDRILPAFASGGAITCLLQSSTATSLLVTSFATRAAITGPAALAAILGADVGTTLAVQVLAQRIDWLSSAFIAIGVFGFLSTTRARARSVFRALLGLGLVMLALSLIGAAAAPLAQSRALDVVVSTLASEGLLTVLLAALLTVMMHSSIAVILNVATLAGHGAISLAVGIALILGANIGSSVIPILSSLTQPRSALRPLAANLGLRVIGALLVLPFIPTIATWLTSLPIPADQTIANAHMAFNIVIAALALPWVAPIDRLLRRLLADTDSARHAGRPSHLDENALSSPAVAIACASREALRIGDVVGDMLRGTIEVFRRNDSDLRDEIETADDEVDRLYEATKLYLTRLTREELDTDEGNRSIEILAFTTNLEHIGDIIDKNLLELASKKIRSRASFSEAGLGELEAFHARVVANLELALNVFVSGDVVLARRLLRQKTEIRDLERQSIERHFARIGEGRSDSIDSSTLHLDVLRDLKRINSHLTAVAYPILERAGELAETRLLPAEADDEPSAARDREATGHDPG